MRKSPNVISFRLDPAHHALLVEQAGASTSPGAYARELVLRALHQQLLTAALEDRLRAITEHQEQLRKDVRLTLQAVIAAAAKLPPEEAQEYVKRILR